MLAQDDKEKAAALQEFFSSVYTTETDDTPETLPIRVDENTRIYYDFVVTQEDIYMRLAKLQTDKSPGPDQLHPRILYETRDVIRYPLFLIFNKSLETGKLPGDWKLTEVTAIYKKGSKHDRSNYRPVSKVQIDSSTEFVSNPILIVQIRTALDQAVDFNEHVTAFTTGRVCTPSSNIKAGNADIQLRCAPAHNQCSITLHLCNAITRRDSDSS